MSRTINKPGNAWPSAFMSLDEIHIIDGKLCGPVRMGCEEAECAQIAKAYAEACVKFERGEVDIAPMAPPEPKEAWEAKFREWENPH